MCFVLRWFIARKCFSVEAESEPNTEARRTRTGCIGDTSWNSIMRYIDRVNRVKSFCLPLITNLSITQQNSTLILCFKRSLFSSSSPLKTHCFLLQSGSRPYAVLAGDRDDVGIERVRYGLVQFHRGVVFQAQVVRAGNLVHERQGVCGTHPRRGWRGPSL